jgi:hypothetical protein
MKKEVTAIFKALQNEFNSSKLKQQFRVAEKYFTRDKVLTFSVTLFFITNFIRKSLSVEIDTFVTQFSFYSMANLRSFTKSAFVQARKKIMPEVFKHLSSVLINEFYSDNDESIKLWNGYRLLAVDGSRLILPQTDELGKKYGRATNQTEVGVVQARVSVLYDVLNKFILDAELSPLSVGENTLAINHLHHTKSNDLVIYDRGYPSFDLIYNHYQIEVDFLMRVKVGFNNVVKDFITSKKRNKIVEFYPDRRLNLKDKEYNKDTKVKVRLILVELDDGEKEVLVTSLLNSKKYNNKLFKDLYFKRWGVETYYDELKNKLKIEHFSGYSDQVILQDFNTAIFVSNAQSLIVGEVENELKLSSNNKKYEYKVNTNLSYGFMKNRIIALLNGGDNINTIMEELKTLFHNNLIPIRPGRTYPRNTTKYKRRSKPPITKNKKDSI